jgi:type VI secretion system protein ImpA
MDSSLLEHWLTPCEPDSPCGIALDYEPDFLALETMLLGKPEQQYGETIIPAEKPEWRTIAQSAGELLKRSKDLRVAAALTRALIAQEGVTGLSKGLGLISTLLNNYWDEVHPRIDEDGERDPMMRSNALAILSDAPSFLAEVRDCSFVSGSGMSLSIREAELVLAPSDVATPPATRDQLQNMLVDQLSRDATKLQAIEYSAAQIDTIAWLCNRHLGAQDAPNLTGAARLFKLLAESVANARTLNTEADSRLGENSGGETATSNVSVGIVPGRLASRADAIRALEAVCAYFEQHEPSSPVPIFLNRAKKLTGMRFIDIIRDMTPESMNTIDVIAGTTNNNS